MATMITSSSSAAAASATLECQLLETAHCFVSLRAQRKWSHVAEMCSERFRYGGRRKQHLITAATESDKRRLALIGQSSKPFRRLLLPLTRSRYKGNVFKIGIIEFSPRLLGKKGKTLKRLERLFCDSTSTNDDEEANLEALSVCRPIASVDNSGDSPHYWKKRPGKKAQPWRRRRRLRQDRFQFASISPCLAAFFRLSGDICIK